MESAFADFPFGVTLPIEVEVLDKLTPLIVTRLQDRRPLGHLPEDQQIQRHGSEAAYQDEVDKFIVLVRLELQKKKVDLSKLHEESIYRVVDIPPQSSKRTVTPTAPSTSSKRQRRSAGASSGNFSLWSSCGVSIGF